MVIVLCIMSGGGALIWCIGNFIVLGRCLRLGFKILGCGDHVLIFGL